MPTFSVDSDSLVTATAAIRGTIERLQSESAALLSQLSALNSTWTGAAAGMFQGSVEQWRGQQASLDDVLASVNAALTAAGQQYADVEQANLALFR